jgi:hypothetical protein
MRHSRAISNDPALKPGRLFVAFLISCAILLVPVALFDIYSFSFLTYVTLLVRGHRLAIPSRLRRHVRWRPLLRSPGRGKASSSFRCVLPVIAGFLAGIALTFVRFQFVPQSHGVFLKGFAASDLLCACRQAPRPTWAKDINETLGDKPRSLHEPVAVIGDDSLWLVRRSQQALPRVIGSSEGQLHPAAPSWRPAFPSRRSDPQSDRPGPWSKFQHLPRRLRRRRRE